MSIAIRTVMHVITHRLEIPAAAASDDQSFIAAG
jgi:hypothetical protein